VTKCQIQRVLIPGLPPKYRVQGDHSLTRRTEFDTREEAEVRRTELLAKARKA
jgi:hypothetical protein